MVNAAPYFSISCDEVTTLDNQYWISIHVYTIQDWRIMPMFLYLQRVAEGGGGDNITKMIFGVVINACGFTPY